MTPTHKILPAVLITLLLAALLTQIASAHPPGANRPPASTLVAYDAGVALHQIDDTDGYPDFVQLVHLNRGAAVKLLHGAIIDPGTGQGVYDGDNPGFTNQFLHNIWYDFTSQHPNTFCITNGQFFSAHTTMARLSFPLKVDGNVVSDGYSLNDYPGQKLMLEIWPDRADIAPLSATALYTSTAPDIIAGLTREASGRRPNMRTGRTFIGVGNPDQHGHYQTILIFTSAMARKTEAAAVLRRFGAEKVMMLDGGSSTQLTCRGQNYVSSGRRIPQSIVVVAALPAAVPHISRQPTAFPSCETEALLARPYYGYDLSVNLWC